LVDRGDPRNRMGLPASEADRGTRIRDEHGVARIQPDLAVDIDRSPADDGPAVGLDDAAEDRTGGIPGQQGHVLRRDDILEGQGAFHPKDGGRAEIERGIVDAGVTPDAERGALRNDELTVQRRRGVVRIPGGDGIRQTSVVQRSASRAGELTPGPVHALRDVEHTRPGDLRVRTIEGEDPDGDVLGERQGGGVPDADRPADHEQ